MSGQSSKATQVAGLNLWTWRLRQEDSMLYKADHQFSNFAIELRAHPMRGSRGCDEIVPG